MSYGPLHPIRATLLRHSLQQPDKVALRDTSGTVTFGELCPRVHGGASKLRSLGVHDGDHVGIVTGNGIAMVEAYLAVLFAGGVGVPVNASMSPSEIGFVFSDADATLIITDAEHLDVTRQARGQDILTGVHCATTQLDVTTGEHSLDAPTPRPESLWSAPSADDLDRAAWILYTSGTTGRPKGVRLSQRNVLWPVTAAWIAVMGLREDDVVLSPIPLNHVYGLVTALATLTVGGTTHLLPRFSPRLAIDALEEYDITVLLGVPTHYDYLLRTWQGPYRRRTLRMCSTGAAPLPPSLADRVESFLHAPLLDGYGATETSTALTMHGPLTPRVRGSVGPVVPGVRLRIVDPPTGFDVAPGEEGEVVANSPGVMLGYHRRQAEESAVLTDGWYKTGDLGKLSTGGYLTLTGRVSELINRGGENVSPVEIEQLVRTHADVADCGVIGLPHESLGEVPMLVVVSHADVEHAELADALSALCRAHLAPFKQPSAIEFAEHLPRSPAGKILRNSLREQVLASHAHHLLPTKGNS